MLRNIFKRLSRRDVSRRVYGQIVAQARQPAFYERLSVPDTVEGRFDMIVLHLIVTLHRLKRDEGIGRKLSQELVDAFFSDMEGSLREMGVSDVVIPKRMKQLVKAFYGRVNAYEPALEAADPDGMSAALARNVLGVGQDVHCKTLATYVLDARAALSEQSADALSAEGINWPAIPAPAATEA